MRSPEHHKTKTYLTEKQDGIRNLLRKRKLARGNRRQKRLPDRLLPPRLLSQRRPRHRRGHRIRRDTPPTPLRCHTPGQSQQRSFGGTVCSMPVQSGVGSLRGDTHDPTRWRGSRRGLGDFGRGEVESCEGLGAEHGAEDVSGEMFHCLFGRGDFHIAQ